MILLTYSVDYNNPPQSIQDLVSGTETIFFHENIVYAKETIPGIVIELKDVNGETHFCSFADKELITNTLDKFYLNDFRNSQLYQDLVNS